MAVTKYTRSNFMSENVIDGILEKDLVDNNWELFEIKRPMTFFTLTSSYIGRPDLLSINLYGKSAYWWILLKYNPDIQDVFNDIKVGDVINVPSIADIEDWVSNTRKRKK